MSEIDSTSPGKSYVSRHQAQEALNAFLLAAETLAHRGQVIEAELRFKEALRTAEREFGTDSDQTMLVLSILAAFYHFQNRTWDYRAIECRLAAWQMKQQDPVPAHDLGALGKQLVGKKSTAPPPEAKPPTLRTMTPEIRKACQILGMAPELGITAEQVNRAWKKQMLHSSAHPDLGGNTDEAVILNKAKTTLMGQLEVATPNLGKRFNKAR